MLLLVFFMKKRVLLLVLLSLVQHVHAQNCQGALRIYGFQNTDNKLKNNEPITSIQLTIVTDEGDTLVNGMTELPYINHALEYNTHLFVTAN